MNEYKCTEERFLADVAEHQMTVIQDDGGGRRHIRFKRDQSRNQQFDLITWPGHLCFTGDMGTYVFSRLADMFTFFRQDRTRPGHQLEINPGYWAEKLLAIDRDIGVKQFSPRRFREEVVEHFKMGWEGETDFSEKRQCWSDLRSALLEPEFMDEGEAMREAMEFRCGDFELRDFWEVTVTEPTFHYIWCCYAIAWGIQQYDAAMEKAA